MEEMARVDRVVFVAIVLAVVWFIFCDRIYVFF